MTNITTKHLFYKICLFLIASAISLALHPITAPADTIEFLTAYLSEHQGKKTIFVEVKNKCQNIRFDSISQCSTDNLKIQVLTTSDMGPNNNCTSLPLQRQEKSAHSISLEQLGCEPKILALMETNGTLSILHVQANAPVQKYEKKAPAGTKGKP